MDAAPYRGRLAPSPTGYLHMGHAKVRGAPAVALMLPWFSAAIGHAKVRGPPAVAVALGHNGARKGEGGICRCSGAMALCRNVACEGEGAI